MKLKIRKVLATTVFHKAKTENKTLKLNKNEGEVFLKKSVTYDKALVL